MSKTSQFITNLRKYNEETEKLLINSIYHFILLLPRLLFSFLQILIILLFIILFITFIILILSLLIKLICYRCLFLTNNT